MDVDELDPEVAREAKRYEAHYQRQELKDRIKREKISRSAPSFGLARLWFRNFKDWYYGFWKSRRGEIDLKARGVAALLDKKNSSLRYAYYNLGARTYRYAEASKRDSYRMGFLKNALNTNPLVHQFAEGIIRQVMEENLKKIGVNGVISGAAGAPAVRRQLNELSIKDLTNLYDRIEDASLPHNRTRVSGGKLSFANDEGGIEVDEGGYAIPDVKIPERVEQQVTRNPDGTLNLQPVKAYLATKLPAGVQRHHSVVMSPTDFWDRGRFNQETHSDLVRTLFTREDILNSIMDHWKLSGHNLAMVLAMRRSALVSQVRAAVFPDSAEHDALPVSATNNQMDASVRLARALGLTPTYATHYFWLIRGNCPNAMAVSQLKREVTELETIMQQQRDYYFKPSSYTPEMVQKRDAAMGAAFNMLMRENLDLPDDQLRDRIKYIMHVFADTPTRSNAEGQEVQQTRLDRMFEVATKLRNLRLLRMTLATPTADEIAKVYAWRQKKYGIGPEEAERNYLAMVNGAMSHAQPQATTVQPAPAQNATVLQGQPKLAAAR